MFERVGMTYWAHSRDNTPKNCWQPLKTHLFAVAERAMSFARGFGSGEFGWVAGLCHDLGKYSREFQMRLEDPRVHVDHSSAGARIAAKKYDAMGRIIAYAVAGHHAGLPDGGNTAVEGSLVYRVDAKDIADCSAYDGEIELPSGLPPLHIRPLAGHCGFSVAFLIRMLFSCLVDADFLDTEQFVDPNKSALRGTTATMFDLEDRLTEHLARKTANAPDTRVNRIRAEVLEDCLAAAAGEPGLFTLTVPTGGGKTLSSLAFALKHARLHGLERVIYAIPFTSIIEQNADVFRNAVGSDVVLEHHSNATDRGRDRREDFTEPVDLAEENWDMPLIATTNVQFFESLFSNRSSRCRKIHNMARSVIILDEAQMLPVELLRPCAAALAELVLNYGATVVLCSATQPALDRVFPEGIEAREIARDHSTLYTALKRVNVRNIGKADDYAIAEKLVAERQVLCIVNTRAHARKLFERLGKTEGCYHLSAAMCPVHRTKRLQAIRARLDAGEVCRVVSTQLIEAGVDVDFPTVFRAIAGIDSIAQAAGRCNREGKRERGEVFVFTPAGGEGMSHVWFKRTASIAAPILDKKTDPLALNAVKRYFSDLYFYERTGTHLDSHGIMERMESGAKSLSFPFEEVASLFKVIGDDTFGIVIPIDEQCKDLLADVKAVGINRSLARQLQRYTVSARPWEFARLRDAGTLEDTGGLAVLRDMRLYDDDYGLQAGEDVVKGGDCWIV